MQAYTVSKNKVIATDLSDIGKKIAWIRAVKPNDDEVEDLLAISNIPREEFQETLEEEERPRLSKKRYIEIIYDAPHTIKGSLLTREIYLYVSDNLIITIEDERNYILDRIETRCKASKNKYMFASQGAFLFHVLDEINDSFLARIDRIAHGIESIRTKELTNVDIDRLYDTSMTFAYFNQAILANLEVLNQLRKLHHKAFIENDRANFNELYIDKLQILDTEKIQRELIMHLINIESIKSAERLNQTMKRLTGFALLIMIPTLVTGMYGMNIPLPFQDHAHAFGIIFTATVVVSLVLLWWMHKMEWV